jgi:tripartite-type tricarboxylate transporter receptor subunit TctC
MKVLFPSLLSCLLCVFSVQIANAQSAYPNRTIQTIMPLQAGSGVDLLFRPIAQKMGESLGQAITIENIPGGAGLIGAGKVVQSPAEGYVLGVFNDSILTMLPNLYKKIDYDPTQSFVPISELAAITFVLVANPSFPGNTAADLVRIAKESQGKLTMPLVVMAHPNILEWKSFVNTLACLLFTSLIAVLLQPSLMSWQVKYQ